MNLLRWGKYRSRADATELVTDRDPTVVVEGEQILLVVTGEEGKPAAGTTHEFRVELTADELARIVESAIEQRGGDATAKTFGSAVGAFLRQLLRNPNP